MKNLLFLLFLLAGMVVAGYQVLSRVQYVYDAQGIFKDANGIELHYSTLQIWMGVLVVFLIVSWVKIILTAKAFTKKIKQEKPNHAK